MILKEKIQISRSFSLEPYNEEKHLKKVEEMKKDPELRHFLMRREGLNIINYNEESVGYVFFDQLHYLDDSISITIGIDKDHRSTEEKSGIGSLIISDITNYLLNNGLCETVVLETLPTDQRGQKMAEKTLFKRDWNLTAKFYEEGYNEIPYVKRKER